VAPGDTAEHHPVVGRMLDREAHVALAHRLEARPAGTACLPRPYQRGAQEAKPLVRDRGHERLLVGEVPIEGGARHAQLIAHTTQRQSVDSVVLNCPDGRLEHGRGEIAVMVAIGPFAGWPGRSAGSHHLMLRTGVDIVNIRQ
jgi:hypothetical protein